jgi:tyrosinase
MGVRKNQADLIAAEWTAFVNAVNAIQSLSASPPRYRDFVRVHVAAMTSAQGMTWGVHTMQNMGTIGRNFLAWHRQYLLLFERRLQQVDASVCVPYWDWISQPSLPAALSTPVRLSA